MDEKIAVNPSVKTIIVPQHHFVFGNPLEVEFDVIFLREAT